MYVRESLREIEKKIDYLSEGKKKTERRTELRLERKTERRTELRVERKTERRTELIIERKTERRIERERVKAIIWRSNSCVYVPTYLHMTLLIEDTL